MNDLYDKILEYIRLYGIKQSLDSDSNFKSKMQEDMAKDISEICSAYFKECIQFEKENSRLIVLVDRLDRENAVKLAACNGRILDLEQQNADLQASLDSEIKSWKIINDYGNQLEKQLADIKYINREEVEKIYSNCANSFDEIQDSEYFITEICSLAKPDKDKIVEVLQRLEIDKTFEEWYVFKYGNKQGLDYKAAVEECIETIANEILEVNND